MAEMDYDGYKNAMKEPSSFLYDCFPISNRMRYYLIDRIKLHVDTCYKEMNSNFQYMHPREVTIIPRRFINEELAEMVLNELLLDLLICYKKEEAHFRGQWDIEKVIKLTYHKYARIVRRQISYYDNNLEKISGKIKKEKIEITKVKRVPKFIYPQEIDASTRFAVIQRANKKCEGCKLPIEAGPINVYAQIDEENGGYKIMAYCEKCAIKYVESYHDK